MRQKMESSVPLFLKLLIFSALAANSDSSPGFLMEDWTGTGCPDKCECKWISGKRTATCRGGLTEVPQFRDNSTAAKIQVIYLSHNPLVSLPQKVFKARGMIDLQKIYLRNCSLAEVHPTAFEGLGLLIELDMSLNSLRTLKQGTFDGHFRIRKLWLQHNRFRSLHDFTFPNISHLRTVDLSHGRLLRLSRRTFHRLSGLEVLHLNDNHFRRLDKRIFSPALKSLKSLTLERNPWVCDCRLQEFWKWLMENNLFNLPTSCAGPKKLQGLTWDKLTESSLACPPEVDVMEPMVTVSTGDDVRLSCLVTLSPTAKLKWVRSGVVINNNTRSSAVDDQDEVVALAKGKRIRSEFQYYTIHVGPADSPGRSGISSSSSSSPNSVISTLDGKPMVHDGLSLPHQNQVLRRQRKQWFNLTIENIHPSGSGAYTCVAQNEGGMSEANATILYSETVATYLDSTDMISTLVVFGSCAGVVVLILVSTFLACFIVQKKRHLEEAARARSRSAIRSTEVIPMNGYKTGSTKKEVVEMVEEESLIHVTNSKSKFAAAEEEKSNSVGSSTDRTTTTMTGRGDSGHGSSLMSSSSGSAAGGRTATMTSSEDFPDHHPHLHQHQHHSRYPDLLSAAPPCSSSSVSAAGGGGANTVSLMDRMWRAEIGSKTHLFSSSSPFHNGFDSLPRREGGGGECGGGYDSLPRRVAATAESNPTTVEGHNHNHHEIHLPFFPSRPPPPGYTRNTVANNLLSESPSSSISSYLNSGKNCADLDEEEAARRDLIRALAKDKSDTVV